MKILVTGGAGFIGSNFIRYIIKKYPDYKIVNLDLLTYAGNPDNLADIEDYFGEPAGSDRRYYFIKGDIRDAILLESIMPKVEAVVHFAAESHVDRSIKDPQNFLSTNILGTQALLEAARKHGIKKFLHISTDEVYGSIKEGYFKEGDALLPNSPYAASKASADLLVRAYYETYKLPVMITRTTNNYGPYQYPEKFIPLFVTNLLEGKDVPLYGYGLNRRDWIHVEDNCAALDAVLHNGEIGEIYNIGTQVNELANIEIASQIVYLLNEPPTRLKFVADRPGHDFRYGVDAAKIKALGWRPRYSIAAGLVATIDWYKNNRAWWEKIKSGEFREYYEKNYQI